jgi:Tol biopolymer transport system component
LKTRSLLLLSLLSPIVALIAGCGGVSKPAATPQFTKMAFLSDSRTVSPPTNLFIQKLDGTGVTPVPLTDQNPYYPSLSADATKIAFSQAGDAWVMNADGSGALQLTTTGNIEFVRISPDGKKVLISEGALRGKKIHISDGSSPHLSIINVDGTGLLNLTPTLPASMTDCYAAAFSADSTQVVFVCDGSSIYGIYTVNPDGTGTATVTNTRTDWTDVPSFSPDNKKIFFVGLGAGKTYDYESVNLDGSGDTVIVPNTEEAIILNSNIYYTFYSTDLKLDQIYKAGLDGSGAAPISDGTNDDYLGLEQ